MAHDPTLIIIQPTAYCNIDCTYCYLSHRDDRRFMQRDVLDGVAENILSKLSRNSAPTIVWHAGEPTTLPTSWYENAYDILRVAAPAATRWAFQTNGIAIDSKWVDFLIRSGSSISVSIDGPQRFHDTRRLTRAGKPTWELSLAGFKRLHAANLTPAIISVLSPESLEFPGEFYSFYRDIGATCVNFNIDEIEAAHTSSSFDGVQSAGAMTRFLTTILRHAFEEQYPLYIKEIERIAMIMSGLAPSYNEQVEPWGIVVISVDGSLSSFSPELVEFQNLAHENFVFGNVKTGDLQQAEGSLSFKSTLHEIAEGVRNCEISCDYFPVCGGGAPANKLAENHSFKSTDTNFCRLSIQCASDALKDFLIHTGQ